MSNFPVDEIQVPISCPNCGLFHDSNKTRCTTSPKAGERTQHTPGPWGIRRYEYQDTGRITRIEIGLRKTIGAFYPAVAQIPGYFDEEAEANARLIAAAPELLNALKWCLDGIEEMRRVGMTEMEGQRAAVFCAIAKAEGTNL